MVAVTVIGVFDLLTVTLRPRSNTEKEKKKKKKKKKIVFLFYFIKLLWINDENRPIPAWDPAKNRAKKLWGGRERRS